MCCDTINDASFNNMPDPLLHQFIFEYLWEKRCSDTDTTSNSFKKQFLEPDVILIDGSNLPHKCHSCILLPLSNSISEMANYDASGNMSVRLPRSTSPAAVERFLSFIYGQRMDGNHSASSDQRIGGNDSIHVSPSICISKMKANDFRTRRLGRPSRASSAPPLAKFTSTLDLDDWLPDVYAIAVNLGMNYVFQRLENRICAHLQLNNTYISPSSFLRWWLFSENWKSPNVARSIINRVFTTNSVDPRIWPLSLIVAVLADSTHHENGVDVALSILTKWFRHNHAFLNAQQISFIVDRLSEPYVADSDEVLSLSSNLQQPRPKLQLNHLVSFKATPIASNSTSGQLMEANAQTKLFPYKRSDNLSVEYDCSNSRSRSLDPDENSWATKIKSQEIGKVKPRRPFSFGQNTRRDQLSSQNNAGIVRQEILCTRAMPFFSCLNYNQWRDLYNAFEIVGGVPQEILDVKKKYSISNNEDLCDTSHRRSSDGDNTLNSFQNMDRRSQRRRILPHPPRHSSSSLKRRLQFPTSCSPLGICRSLRRVSTTSFLEEQMTHSLRNTVGYGSNFKQKSMLHSSKSTQTSQLPALLSNHITKKITSVTQLSFTGIPATILTSINKGCNAMLAGIHVIHIHSRISRACQTDDDWYIKIGRRVKNVPKDLSNTATLTSLEIAPLHLDSMTFQEENLSDSALCLATSDSSDELSVIALSDHVDTQLNTYSNTLERSSSTQKVNLLRNDSQLLCSNGQPVDRHGSHVCELNSNYPNNNHTSHALDRCHHIGPSSNTSNTNYYDEVAVIPPPPMFSEPIPIQFPSENSHTTEKCLNSAFFQASTQNSRLINAADDFRIKSLNDEEIQMVAPIDQASSAQQFQNQECLLSDAVDLVMSSSLATTNCLDYLRGLKDRSDMENCEADQKDDLIPLAPRIVVCGGVGTKGVEYSMQAYHQETGVWISLPTSHLSRSSSTCVAVQDSLFVFGGETACGSCERYDGQSNSWVTLEPSQSCLIGSAATISSSYSVDEIFITGGQKDSGQTMASFSSYFFELDMWEENVPMPEPRAFHCSAVFDNKLLVIGGINATGHVTNLGKQDIMYPIVAFVFSS